MVTWWVKSRSCRVVLLITSKHATAPQILGRRAVVTCLGLILILRGFRGDVVYEESLIQLATAIVEGAGRVA